MNREANACSCGFSTEDIVAFVAGNLEADPRATAAEVEVAEHLGECRACCDDAVEFRSLGRILGVACSTGVVRWHRFPTPFGPMYVAATDRGLSRISWQQKDGDAFVEELEERFPQRPVVRDPEGLRRAERELREYFAGERKAFDLPVDLDTLTAFQRRVLKAASQLGHGEVVPYAELARRVGRPEAYRSVGNALGKNPVAIVVPCHRVIRSDGSMGGYGGGPEYKEYLLRLEGRSDLLRTG